MLNKKRTTILLSLVMASMGVMVATPSDACLIATKPLRFPGVACVQASTGGTLAMTIDGAVYNNTANGGSSLVVDCPVVGSRSGNSNPFNVKLWYLDDSSSAISCTYFSEASDGDAFTSTSASSNRDDNVYSSLTLGITTLTEGFSHIRCSIPAKDPGGAASYIIGYEGL